MRKSLSIWSFVIFSFNLLLYFLSFFVGIDVFPGKVMLLLLVGGSIIGIILAMIGQRGTLRNFGLFGNFIVLLVSAIIPTIVTTFFWNRP
jgi:hypothetical protein